MIQLARWFGTSDRTPSRGFRFLAVATAVATYLLIVVGGIVRVSGSGLGCGTAGGQNDWPFCRGGLLPPLERTAVIEFSHRWLAATVSVLAIVLLVAAWARYRHLRAVAWTSTIFVVFLVVQIVLGAITVLNLLPPNVIMVHLANAELLLGCTTLLCILAFTGGRVGRSDAARDEARIGAARWMAVAAAVTFGLVLSGSFVVDQGAGFACAGWPLCGNGVQLDPSRLATFNLGHRIVAGVAAILLVLAHIKAVRAYRGVRSVRIVGSVVMAMLLAQIVAGAVLVESRLPAVTRSVHEALASALWASVILLALLVRPGMLALAGSGATAEHGAPATEPRLPSPRATPVGSRP